MEVKKEDGVLLIYCNNVIKQYEGELSLESLHRELGCDVIEFCESICGGILVIDEEGKCTNKMVNSRATALYKYSFGSNGKLFDIIVGDALYIPRSIFVKWDNEQEEDDESAIVSDLLEKMVDDIKSGELSAEDIADKYVTCDKPEYRQAVIDKINNLRNGIA